MQAGTMPKMIITHAYQIAEHLIWDFWNCLRNLAVWLHKFMVIECSNTQGQMNYWWSCVEKKKKKALNDSKATTLLPGPTLTMHLGEWQSQLPAQSCHLSLMLLTWEACCRAGTDSPARQQQGTLSHMQHHHCCQERDKRQKPSEITKTNQRTLDTQTNSLQRRICKSQCFHLLSGILIHDLNSSHTFWTWIHETALNFQYMNKWFFESQHIYVIYDNMRLSSSSLHSSSHTFSKDNVVKW